MSFHPAVTQYLYRMFYLHHTPWWIRRLFPSSFQWEGVAGGNKVYLSFDDGPHPEVTPWVLQQLEIFNMKATFFCIGKNVVRFPEVYASVLAGGHAVGNHTMNHANAKKVSKDYYLTEIANADIHINSPLFRPPYGQLSRSQYLSMLAARPQTKVVMWSALSGDFDLKISGQQCFRRMQPHIKPGAILLFHDSTKAWPRLKISLPLTLEYLAAKGYRSHAITI